MLDLFDSIEIHHGVKPDEQEVWKRVEGFERYEVSSHGRFRNGSKYINGSKNHNGYIHIGLIRSGKQEWFLAHRIVAMTFLKIQGKPIVNHKDRDKTNNRVSNLEWSSYSHNAKHWRDDKRTR